MQSERHHARRYPFVASVELTDVQSDARVRGQTSDLSLFGCRVDTRKPLPTGTKVGIWIVHRGAHFIALGRVANVRLYEGMGVVFTKIEPDQQLVLDKWIAELRDSREPGAR